MSGRTPLLPVNAPDPYAAPCESKNDDDLPVLRRAVLPHPIRLIYSNLWFVIAIMFGIALSIGESPTELALACLLVLSAVAYPVFALMLVMVKLARRFS
jgi:hypothetical protein